MKEKQISKNAIIKGTMLGYEDHGIFTWGIHIEWNGGGVMFGNRALDEPLEQNGVFLKREGTPFGIESIKALLDTVGVSEWEQLKGKHVRIKAGLVGGNVTRIAHIIDDNWWDIEEMAKEYYDKWKSGV